jgi:hypothetical protein
MVPLTEVMRPDDGLVDDLGERVTWCNQSNSPIYMRAHRVGVRGSAE